MPGLVPKFSRTPGAIKDAGPRLGGDTDAILGEVLGYPPERIAALRAQGVI
jgi:crotonobetainyl-CoA:carnitine CoA-transferase CaiB-like acyl-CoA transferase